MPIGTWPFASLYLDTEERHTRCATRDVVAHEAARASSRHCSKTVVDQKQLRATTAVGSDHRFAAHPKRKSSEQRTPLWVGRHRVGTHPAQPILQQPMFPGAHKFYEELVIGPRRRRVLMNHVFGRSDDQQAFPLNQDALRGADEDIVVSADLTA